MNGQLVQSETWLGAPGLGFETMAIGLDREGTRPFSGVVDEVQVFNRALSADEIAIASLRLRFERVPLLADCRFEIGDFDPDAPVCLDDLAR